MKSQTPVPQTQDDSSKDKVLYIKKTLRTVRTPENLLAVNVKEIKSPFEASCTVLRQMKTSCLQSLSRRSVKAFAWVEQCRNAICSFSLGNGFSLSAALQSKSNTHALSPAPGTPERRDIRWHRDKYCFNLILFSALFAGTRFPPQAAF